MAELDKVIRGLRDIDMFIAGRLEHEKAKNFLRAIDETIALLKEQKEKMEHLNNITLEYEKEVFRLQILLKEQEAVEPYMDFDGHDVWRCGKCGATIFHIYHNASDEDAKNYAKFCRHCGRSVKWNDRN